MTTRPVAHPANQTTTPHHPPIEGEKMSATPRVIVRVTGEPIGQGNIRHLGKGRPAVHQNAKRLKPWREAITAQTRAQMAEQKIAPFDGPVNLFAVFWMPRGKTVKREQHTVRPDIDHLGRALCDAITASGAVRDDSQIITMTLHKAYETPEKPPGVGFFLEAVAA